MSELFSFDSTSPRFRLPFLFVGQAQKEAWVNEAHARIDVLLHCAVEGELAEPPLTPADGEAWLVATPASGLWAGKEGAIAARQADNWLYVTPTQGMRIYDKSASQERLFTSAWQNATAPAEPTGGSVVDSQARAVLAELISALRVSGIFPES